MLDAGADVIRLNLAHGDPGSHEAIAGIAREEAEKTGRIVGLLADLPGPKMRTGNIAKERVVLHSGEKFELTTEDVEGDWTRVSTNVPNLEELVTSGEEIFLADGTIVLEVKNIKRGTVETVVRRGGALRSRKGLHLPGRRATSRGLH